jgi:hypothetical protein
MHKNQKPSVPVASGTEGFVYKEFVSFYSDINTCNVQVCKALLWEYPGKKPVRR